MKEEQIVHPIVVTHTPETQILVSIPGQVEVLRGKVDALRDQLGEALTALAEALAAEAGVFVGSVVRHRGAEYVVSRIVPGSYNKPSLIAAKRGGRLGTQHYLDATLWEPVGRGSAAPPADFDIVPQWQPYIRR